MIYTLVDGGKTRTLEVVRSEGGWVCRLDGRDILLDVERIDRDTLSLIKQGEAFAVRRVANRAVWVRGRYYEISITDRRSWRGQRQAAGGHAGAENLKATMPGKVVRLLAREGDKVIANQGIVVVEAMKMQNEIRSPKTGILRRLRAEVGMNVNAGEVLAIVE